jgi:hypothetical protein
MIAGRWIRAVFFVVLAVFFVVFHARVVRVHFGSDEMMNLYGYWHPPLGKVVAAYFAPWIDLVRPMGAIYYLPLYRLFGLNPYPFSLVRLAFLFVNTIVFFLLAKQLTRSWWIAMLASFPVAYQSTIGNLHYDGAFIYDILCGGFYFAAFFYYLRCRKATALTIREACIFLALYICALDSKEMAVSLPVLILAYELLFRRPKAKVATGLIAAAVTLVFILAKTVGPAALTSIGGYRPEYTWARFTDSITRFSNEIFYTDSFTTGRVLLLWAFLLVVGLLHWVRRSVDPRWLFLLMWVVVTPLPIAFLADRSGATLYIVLAGWAMMAALAARTAVHVITRLPLGRLPRAAVMAAGLAACIAAYWHETGRADRKAVPRYLKNGEDTQQTIAQLQALRLRPEPHSVVVFLHDPFPDYYDTLFIASLVWKDPTIDIWLQNHRHLPEADLARANYTIDYADGRFVDRTAWRDIR